MLILGFPELHLVGGSGPHEGNILVGGRPVCDDGHNAQNALVVCRFPFLSWCNDIKQATENSDYFIDFPNVTNQDAGLLLRPPNPLVALRRGGAQLRDGQRAVPWQ